MPWSLRLASLLVLASAGVFAWSKRPLVGDAEKVCRVAELSACPWPESSLVSNDCKIAWLERSMWSFGRLAQLPRGGGPGRGDFLRALARAAGVSPCPEADVVDREFEGRRQQAEAAKHALAEPEPGSTSDSESAGTVAADDSDAAPTEKRPSGTVRSEAPSVEGPLDPSVVSKEVRVRIGAVKACYERALKRKPNLSGKVKMRWTITAAGTVSAVEVEADSMGDTEVASCIKGLIRRWRFLAPAGGSVDVVYPFLFQTTKEVAP
jgi:TonB family protein